MLKAEEIEQFAKECGNTIADALNDLEKMNVGLAKDRLYLLLKQSVQLSDNIENSKPFSIVFEN